MKIRLNKRIINYFMRIIIVSVLIGLGITEHKESQIEQGRGMENARYVTQNLSANCYEHANDVVKDAEKVKEYPKEDFMTQYRGYQVIAKLEIPIIALETYVLEKYSKDALNISVTKFWGANPNDIGNFCVAGHNFQNKNMFHNLKKLEIGNRLFIVDHSIGKLEYEVYDIFVVRPEDVSCLSQETNQKREVTLITCTNDSEKRIIVKAQEVL